MMAETCPETREINTLEEYTLYSLDRSLPTLLRMMEGSKEVAHHWPDLKALVDAASLCREMAALACFQDTLADVVGEMTGEPANQWARSRALLKDAMSALGDALNMGDPEIAIPLFAVHIPASLNAFAEAIPAVGRHVREVYMTQSDKPDTGEQESDHQ
jgi:hypothetical protein